MRTSLLRLERLAPLALLAALILIVYRSALEHLILHDWGSEDYSYCYIIPFLLAYLAWERKDAFRKAISSPTIVGVIPVVMGIALFWLGELGGEFYTLYISFWLVLVGLLWIHWGWEKLKRLVFVLAMSLTLFPLPDIFNFPLSLKLKLISSWLGVVLLQLYGVSAYREGNVIDLGFTQLQVVDACSGLRYVLPLVVLSLVLAYWFKVSIWKRIVLFLSSVPIAIVVNSFRIAVTGVLYGIWGAAVAEKFFHGFSAWLLFLITIPVLLVEMEVLKWLPPREAARTAHQVAEQAPIGRELCEEATHVPGIRVSKWYLTLIPILLLGLTALLSHFVDFRERVPLKKPLGGFPIALGEWSGTREAMEEQFLKELKFSDYAMVNYVGTEGKSVSFYTAYYETQRKGESTHSPETCLPGSGWEFHEAGTVRVRSGDGREMLVKRAFIEKSGARQLAYYWFQQRGRVLTNLYEVKFFGFWDALTRRRSDGALVRLITPVYQSEELSAAEKRLQEFTALIVPVLKEYIPE